MNTGCRGAHPWRRVEKPPGVSTCGRPRGGKGRGEKQGLALRQGTGCRNSFPQRPAALPRSNTRRRAGSFPRSRIIVTRKTWVRENNVLSSYGVRAPHMGLVSLGPPRERDSTNSRRSGAQSCHLCLSSLPRLAQRPIDPTGPRGLPGCYCFWWLQVVFTYLLIYFASQTQRY